MLRTERCDGIADPLSTSNHGSDAVKWSDETDCLYRRQGHA